MKVTSNKKGDTLIIISFLNKQTNKHKYPCQKALTPIYIYFAESLQLNILYCTDCNVAYVASDSDSVTSHQSHDSKPLGTQQLVSKYSELQGKYDDLQEKYKIQRKHNNL